MQAVDQLLALELDQAGAAVEVVDVLDADRLVVLGGQRHRARLDPEVDVLRDQDHLPRRLALRERQGGVQDAVVVLLRAEQLDRVDPARLLRDHQEPALARPVDRDPVPQVALLGELVEVAHELPRVEVDDVVALLELVELLEHRQGHGHVVLLERGHGLEVVEDDRGVEDEDLPGRRFRHRRQWESGCGGWRGTAAGDARRAGGRRPEPRDSGLRHSP